MHNSFDRELLRNRKDLMAYTMKLVGNVTRAEDLVQATMLRALEHKESYRNQGKMLAWLFTIAKNIVRSEYRRQKREVYGDDADTAIEAIECPEEQPGHVELRQISKILRDMPHTHSETLVLVGALGHDYEEVSKMTGAPVGTVKSRVHRARKILASKI